MQEHIHEFPQSLQKMLK